MYTKRNDRSAYILAVTCQLKVTSTRNWSSSTGLQSLTNCSSLEIRSFIYCSSLEICSFIHCGSLEIRSFANQDQIQHLQYQLLFTPQRLAETIRRLRGGQEISGDVVLTDSPESTGNRMLRTKKSANTQAPATPRKKVKQETLGVGGP